MSRNAKCRRICAEFENKNFYSEAGIENYITINVDELEAMRLCDFEGLDQEEAATRMQISRGTFQRILYSGRKKSTQALCTGSSVLIEGGNYEVAKAPCDRSPICKCCMYSMPE
ncbi:DUF134 domain-containing protein [Clostridium sp. Marseille-P299]|uniref:DUF134 domain-containing protein n=1 Tax=Clostridium sp. Marseille-P299 TaxID=1805477 RepID=UPI000835B5CD|nr:DUF134 domain-containing protein [Clostridium sp. Marseille-P299]